MKQLIPIITVTICNNEVIMMGKQVIMISLTRNAGFGQKTSLAGWNAARAEPFDFLLHNSNPAVCKYSGLSYKSL